MNNSEEGEDLPKRHGSKAAVVSRNTSAPRLVTVVVALLVVEHQDIVDIVGDNQARDEEGSDQERDHGEN